jgi:hypothetical protein
MLGAKQLPADKLMQEVHSIALSNRFVDPSKCQESCNLALVRPLDPLCFGKRSIPGQCPDPPRKHMSQIEILHS